MNKSSRFNIFHPATLEDFFDGFMYVITSKECNICPCTHTIHLPISISSGRLQNQMNGVQTEEVQLAIGIPKIQLSEDTLFMKNMLLYFFEVATTSFMDNIEENMSRGSRPAKENPSSLGIGPARCRELQLRLQCSAMSLPSLQNKPGLPTT